MKFLVDQNLSPTLAALLRTAGHDVVHTGHIDSATADDHSIVTTATRQDRVIVSADTDFGALLAQSGAGSPSVLLLRLRSPRRARLLADLLLANLDAVADSGVDAARSMVAGRTGRVLDGRAPFGPSRPVLDGRRARRNGYQVGDAVCCVGPSARRGVRSSTRGAVGGGVRRRR